MSGLRYAISRETDDTVVAAWRGPRECVGFVTIRRLEVGATQVRAVDGSRAVHETDEFTFGIDPTIYTVTRNRDFDTKTQYNKGFWDFLPPLVNTVEKGTLVTFANSTPPRRKEVTPDDYEILKQMDLPMGLGHRWKYADDGTKTETLDRRKTARFTNGLPVAAWDDAEKKILVKRGAAGVTVDIEVLDDSGNRDVGFSQDVILQTDAGKYMVIEFSSGVKTLDINTSKSAPLRFGDSTVLKIEKLLEVIVCAVNELRPGDNG